MYQNNSTATYLGCVGSAHRPNMANTFKLFPPMLELSTDKFS